MTKAEKLAQNKMLVMYKYISSHNKYKWIKWLVKGKRQT